ncbi:metallopeptidase TldD-related protein [Nocardioidaceae bacterium SCSIO 66511]|nr:metallopeptidase TldD-related protein [Nocardioidaceae bacterium SCSIO 66511]
MQKTTPQDLVERGLEQSTADGCVVIVDRSSNANLRWANNTLTTNGVARGSTVTVISTVDGSSGTAAASLSRSASALDEVAALVERADRSAREASPADDAAPLIDGEADDDWSAAAETTTIDVLEPVARQLGNAFARARSSDRLLFGYAEHDLTTTYLGSSTGLRRRHVQPGGHIGITGKDSTLTRSAWVGQSTRDFADVDALALDSELDRRLGWAQRSVDLDAGRYDTVLPPTAVADLMIYAYWSAGGREAYDGQSVFSRPGGGTRIGDRLSDRPVQVFSDPAAPGLECSPFAVEHASASSSSVFDNGLPLHRTNWVADGELRALRQSRHSAALSGHDATPGIENLLVEVDDATGTTEELVADVERGLLLTCLWYIREVDAQTLLLTGLTRDGVYLVENGEITGAVNNFRFNESPVDLLDRFSHAGASVPSFSREWGDEFLRTSTPALRVPDFNMSSVSQAR